MPEVERNTADLDLMIGLAAEAGAIAMKWFREDPQVWMKEGDSPVSEADFAVDNFLKEKLREARPGYGWLSEETDDDLDRLKTERTFVVDPIDGTRGFINGMKQWCVSIAVVENKRPVAGVLECPVLKQTIAASVGGGARLNNDALFVGETSKPDIIRVTGPRSLQTAVGDLSDLNMQRMPFVPSLAYRLAMIAMGEIDLALARSSAKDWDLAAADLIVHEAGGVLSDVDGATLSYNCRDIRHGTLVASRAKERDEMLDLARQAMNKTSKTKLGKGGSAMAGKEGSKQLLHLVFGGELSSLKGVDFRNLEELDVVGIFPDYESARKAWKAKAQGSVDNAHMRYFVVHLHRLLDPEKD